MNVQNLIRMLEDLDPEAEVRLAIQPSYPFEHRLGGVRYRSKNQEAIDDIHEAMRGGELTEEEKEEASDRLLELDETDEKIVYLLEGGQIGYASRNLWNED